MELYNTVSACPPIRRSVKRKAFFPLHSGFFKFAKFAVSHKEINMLTNAVRSKYCMTSAFPEHTASSPARPYTKKQAVLEVVCHPCH